MRVPLDLQSIPLGYAGSPVEVSHLVSMGQYAPPKAGCCGVLPAPPSRLSRDFWRPHLAVLSQGCCERRDAGRRTPLTRLRAVGVIAVTPPSSCIEAAQSMEGKWEGAAVLAVPARSTGAELANRGKRRGGGRAVASRAVLTTAMPSPVASLLTSSGQLPLASSRQSRRARALRTIARLTEDTTLHAPGGGEGVM